jgi:xanthine dehydrogenase accessory factor
LVAREPVCLVANLEDDSVTNFVLYTESSIDQADSVAQALFERGKSDSEIVNNKIISVFWPVPKIVIVGTGPNAQALRESAELLGWQTVITSDAGSAQGVIAGVSALDSIVIMIHDLDIAGAALSAALSSNAGYIGALGSKRMQETRAEWLAYRGITDLTRIHGPAGINIGAKTPAEIAISILAQALSVVKLG